MKAYFASKNESKLRRMNKIFQRIDSNIVIEAIPELIEVKENGRDVLENSLQKILPYKNKYSYPVIAGDTAVFFEGEIFDPTHVKRICLGREDELKLTQQEIGERMKSFYINLAKKYGGRKEFYFEDGWAVLFPDGSHKQIKYKRDYILTDTLQGEFDIFFPLRSLYIVKATGKNIFEQTEEDYFKEFALQIVAFKKLFKHY